MKFTRQQLIQGIMQVNKNYLDNPKDFDEINTSKECAERQIDDIISHIK